MKETLDLRGLNFEEGYIAVIDKPLNWTSTDVVRKIKFALRKLGYRKIKVGHAGTLDPLASGILLVCIGRATKMVDALQAEEKEYVADVMLGATTPSYDLEHPVDATFPTQHITRGKVLEALAALSGERRRSIRPKRSTACGPTNWLERARRSKCARRSSTSTKCSSKSTTCRASASAYDAARAPTSVRWPTKSGRRSKAART